MLTWVAILGVLSGAAAERRAVMAEPPPVVLMVRAGTTPEQKARERKLYDELTIALDSFMVMSQNAELADFSRLPLSDQVAHVLPVANTNGAVIVVWLVFPLPNQVMLHVVALGTGRALVRTIESERSKTTESSLALMARELLGTAYLFEPPKSVPLEVRTIVRNVKEKIDSTQAQAPAPSAKEPPAPPPPPWGLWLRVESGFGLVDFVAAAPAIGLGVALERRLGFRIDASLAVMASLATLIREEIPNTTARTLGGALTFYRGFGNSIVSVGPALGAGVHWGYFRADTEALNTVLAKISGGIQARVDSASGPVVSAMIAVDYLPLRPELRSPQNQVLFRAPSLELHLSLGVGWQGL